MSRGRDGLVALWLLAAAAQRTWAGPCCQDTPLEVAKAIDSLRAAQQVASEKFHADYDRAASDPERQAALDSFYPKVQEHSEQALDLARRFPRDPAALDALAFVILTAKAGPTDDSKRALELLVRDHARDPRIERITGWITLLYHLQETDDLLRKVIDENPDRATRASALYGLAQVMSKRSRRIREFRADPAKARDAAETIGQAVVDTLLRDGDPERSDNEAIALMERVIRDDGGAMWDGRRPLREVVAGDLFRLQHLQIGKVAPEIDGEDAEGRRFRLSEYRGKVVILTFSGNWCGPCKALYPQERELVERLRDRPFVLLSVNTDDDRDTLRQSIAHREVTWRCWWDGGTDGPITLAWGVHSFPTLYVIDAQGVIRFQVREESELDRAVETLLGELAGAAEKPGVRSP